jgi:hypothetical protein
MARKTLCRVVGVVLVPAGVSLVALPAAHAAESTVVVTATSTHDSTKDKTAVATCPPGLPFVHGAGGQVHTDGAPVVLTAARPDPSLSSVTAQAHEHGPSTSPWSVTAYAVCGAGSSRLVRVSAATGLGSQSPKTASTTCPTGLQLLGTGFDLDGEPGKVLLTGVQPGKGLTEVSVTAYETDGFTGDWAATAYGVCGDPISGAALVSVTGALSTDTPQTTVALCPEGTVLHGLGGEVQGGEGGVVLNGLAAGDVLERGAARGESFWWYWLFAYTVTATAICAP